MNEPTDRSSKLREHISVVLLATTAILTAWSGFQSTKWGGAMSISFSQASSSRIEASRLDGEADIRQSVQVGLFTQWVSAYGSDNTEVADFLVSRFPEPLATAFQDWLAQHPLENPDAAKSPFDMPSYQLEERTEAAASDKKADEKFQQALTNNARGDEYTLLTVLFATVLFFAAISQRPQGARAQLALLALAIVMLVGGVAFLLTLPKLI